MVMFVAFLLAFAGMGGPRGVNAERESTGKGSDGDSTALRYGSKVVGIDLGTTYSCVGVYENGRVSIIANDQGNRVTPSYVAFTESERLIGDAAKNQASGNPLNTVFDAKRMIGRKFSSKEVKADKKLWPFEVVSSSSGTPLIEVQFKGEKKQFSPEEISAFVLQKMKKTAEDYLGEEVTHAVVTVPAYFDNTQRTATKDAGRIAGLEVVRILNEPTAAAIAYGLNQGVKEKNIVVYDLGGGTFDVSVLTIDDGFFEVLSTNGHTHLGGQDFDQAVIDHIVKTFKKKHKMDPSTNPRAMSRLRKEVEKAKRALSSVMSVKVEIESFYEGLDLSETLSRARFEQLNAAAFKRTMGPLKQALEDAKLSKTDIDEIVLVGGSSRIPKIQEMLKKFFMGKAPTRGVNPDEAVAHGAAIQAGLLGNHPTMTENIAIVDVTPLSLGIETVGGMMTNIVMKNTAIPTEKSQIFSTHVDNQPAVTIQIFQGERVMTKHNIALGSFTLEGIPPSPRGQPQIEVTFAIDTNGVINVKAKDKGTNKSSDMKISMEDYNLSKDEIDKMMADAEANADADKELQEKVNLKNKLEGMALAAKSAAEDEENGLSEDDRMSLKEIAEEAEDWLASEVGAGTHLADIDMEDLQEKLEELTEAVQPILGSAGGAEAGYDDDDEGDDDFEDHDEL